MLVDGHQVVGLASRAWESLLEKLIEGLEIVEPPVLPGSHLTQVAAELHKPGIALPIDGLLPAQDFIDLGQHKQSPASVELRRHQGSPISRQGR